MDQTAAGYNGSTNALELSSSSYTPSPMLYFWSTRLPRAFTNDISTLVDIYDWDGVDYIFRLVVVGSSFLAFFLFWILNLFIITAIYRGCFCCGDETVKDEEKENKPKKERRQNRPYMKKDVRQRLENYKKRLVRCRHGFIGTGIVLVVVLLALIIGIVSINEAFNELTDDAVSAHSAFDRANEAATSWINHADVVRELSQNNNFQLLCPGAASDVLSQYATLQNTLTPLLFESSSTSTDVGGGNGTSLYDAFVTVQGHSESLYKITEEVSKGLYDAKAWFWSSVAVVSSFFLVTLAVVWGTLFSKWDGWGLPIREKKTESRVNEGTNNSGDIESATRSSFNGAKSSKYPPIKKEDGTIDDSPMACCGKTQNQHWKRFFSMFAVPSFVILGWLNCLVTSGFAVTFTMNADFCTSGDSNIATAGPDVTVDKMMSHTSIDPSVYLYYINGCRSGSTRNIDPLLQGIITPQSQYFNWAFDYETFLSTSFPGDTSEYAAFCGSDSANNNNADASASDSEMLEAQLMEPLWRIEKMSNESVKVQSALNCQSVIYPLYEHATYDTFCTKGSNRIIWVLITLGVASILALIMITFRVVPKLEFKYMIEIRDMLEECDRAYAECLREKEEDDKLYPTGKKAEKQTPQAIESDQIAQDDDNDNHLEDANILQDETPRAADAGAGLPQPTTASEISPFTNGVHDVEERDGVDNMEDSDAGHFDDAVEDQEDSHESIDLEEISPGELDHLEPDTFDNDSAGNVSLPSDHGSSSSDNDSRGYHDAAH